MSPTQQLVLNSPKLRRLQHRMIWSVSINQPFPEARLHLLRLVGEVLHLQLQVHRLHFHLVVPHQLDHDQLHLQLGQLLPNAASRACAECQVGVGLRRPLLPPFTQPTLRPEFQGLLVVGRVVVVHHRLNGEDGALLEDDVVQDDVPRGLPEEYAVGRLVEPGGLVEQTVQVLHLLDGFEGQVAFSLDVLGYLGSDLGTHFREHEAEVDHHQSRVRGGVGAGQENRTEILDQAGLELFGVPLLLLGRQVHLFDVVLLRVLLPALLDLVDPAFNEVPQALVVEFELRTHLPVLLPQVPAGELLSEDEGQWVDDLGSNFFEQGARKLAQSFALHFQTLALGFSPAEKQLHNHRRCDVLDDVAEIYFEFVPTLGCFVDGVVDDLMDGWELGEDILEVEEGGHALSFPLPLLPFGEGDRLAHDPLHVFEQLGPLEGELSSVEGIELLDELRVSQ